MRIALIGDIHANLPALEEMLAHARRQGIDEVWNLGDYVGYGAHPEEVIREARRLEDLSIVGNYDLKVLQFKKKSAKWRQTKHPRKFQAFKWAYENLSKESRRYLRKLPQEVRRTVGGHRILVTHGSPASNDEPLTPSTPANRFRALGKLAGADLVLCGHSHIPFKRREAGVWFINPGSIGRPGDGDSRSSYAILHFADGDMQITHFRVSYDVARAVAAIRAAGLPEEFAQMLVQGRSLDEIRGQF